jgi:hypothetical protein
MTRIFPDDVPPNGGKGSFELTAARGEVECCQVGVQTDGIYPNTVRAEVSDLTGPRGTTIARENVDILYPEFVPVKWGF